MINGKTYYQILGVLDDAEDIVIRAAYKVLAQKYHPDKFSGDKSVAEQKMSEINQAYEVLSNSGKRKTYDESLGRNEYQSAEEDDWVFEGTVGEDWKEVLSYFPDLKEITQKLRRVSRSLETTYILHLLESKSFDDRFRVAEFFKKSYMQRYFGTKYEILRFAEFCIETNQRSAAKALNKAVNLLGPKTDPIVIIKKIMETYFSVINTKKLNLAFNICLEDNLSALDYFQCQELLRLDGARIDPIANDNYSVKYAGETLYYPAAKIKELARSSARRMIMQSLSAKDGL